MKGLRTETKTLMKKLKVTQADLVRQINRRGKYTVTPPEMSSILSGAITTPKAHRVLSDCVSILKRKESMGA